MKGLCGQVQGQCHTLRSKMIKQPVWFITPSLVVRIEYNLTQIFTVMKQYAVHIAQERYVYMANAIISWIRNNETRTRDRYILFFLYIISLPLLLIFLRKNWKLWHPTLINLLTSLHDISKRSNSVTWFPKTLIFKMI